jgi:hypothetical protein
VVGTACAIVLVSKCTGDAEWLSFMPGTELDRLGFSTAHLAIITMVTLGACVFSVLLLVGKPVPNAPLGVRVGHPVAVFSDTTMPSVVEPILAVSPTDPKRLIVAAQYEDAAHIVVAQTSDGGRSWTRATRENGNVFPGGDPSVTLSLTGRAYLAAAPRFGIWISDDGGARWTRAAEMSGVGIDRDWLAVDPSSGSHPDWVYAAAKMPIRVFGSQARDVAVVALSRDGGHSFENVGLLLPDPARYSLHVVSDALVDQRGRLILAMPVFLWNGTSPSGLLDGRYLIVGSGDKGLGLGRPVEAARFRVYGHANEVMSMKSTGGGRLALDRSQGKFGGRLYLAFLDGASGHPQVFVVHSSDGATTWSSPVRVNTGGFDVSQSNPAIAVNRNGVVAVTWNDRRHDATDHCYEPYAAFSLDGGESFVANMRLADTRACPDDGDRWSSGGDTQGLVALPDGRFMAAWISGQPRTELFTSTIDLLP